MPFITRRHFILSAAGAVSAAALGDAFLIEPTAIDVTRHDRPLPGLPPAWHGLRVACPTDVHLNGGVSPAAHAALEVLARERPDVVVLIGDICNHEDDLPVLTAWARDARGTAATYATFGNWEHDAGIDRSTAERAYAQAGVELLYNSAGRATVRGATLTVVGLDDPVVGHPDLGAGLATVRSGDAALWEMHAQGWEDQVPRAVAPTTAAFLAGPLQKDHITLQLLNSSPPMRLVQ